MYIIIKRSIPCFGLKPVPDRYVTQNNIVVDGEFEPIMDKNIDKAQRFENYNDANERVKEIIKLQLFNTNPKYEIIPI